MNALLDRPIWHALNSRQSAFAEGGTAARRYRADVSPFAASDDDSSGSLAALADLIPSEGTVVLLQAHPCPPVSNTEVVLAAAGVQMIAHAVRPLPSSPDIVELGAEDAADMLELATLTKPGPFLLRTHELGSFVGIRSEGKLVAMAGERLKVPGFTEISGVCTHPDFRGRGYAGLLSRIMATRISERGETPFLHALASNASAIRLYEELGFKHHQMMSVTVLTRS